MSSMEANYKSILDQATDAVYVTDMDYNLLYANETALKMGNILFHAKQAEGKCYKCMLGRDEPCPFCKVDKMKELPEGEFMVRTFKGATGRIFELRGGIIEWSGQPAHIEYIRNVTEKENAIRQSEELSRLQKNLYEHIGVGMCLYRYKDGKIWPQLCNDNYRKLFILPGGFDSGEPVELELRNFFEEDRERIKTFATEHVEAAESFHSICRVRDTESGLPKSVLIDADCVKHDEGDYLWYLTAFDVTEWIEQENQLNNIISSLNGGVVVYQVHHDGKVRRVMYTDGIPAMHDCSRQEYESLDMGDSMNLVYYEDRERIRREVMDAVRNQQKFSSAYRVFHKSKDYIWVNISAMPIGMDSEGCMRYTAVFTNASYQFELYQEILNLSENGLIVTDISTHEIYFTNKAAEKILLMARENCIYRNECNVSGECSRTLCSKSVLLPRTEGQSRQVTVGERTYQVGTHAMRWMNRDAIVQYLGDISEEINLKHKLMADEERYRLVVEQSGMALMDYDLKTGNIYMNDRFRDYMVSTVENIQDYFNHVDGFSKVHPDDEVILRKFYSELEESHRATTKLRAQLSDGSYRWTEMSALDVTDNKGNSIRKIGFFRDVDEITRQYEDLKVRYDYELTRQNSFEDGVVERMLLDLTDDRIIQAASSNNKSLTQLIGMSMEDLVRVRLSHTYDEDDKKALQEFMNREFLMNAYYTMQEPVLDMLSPVANSDEKKYFRSSVQLARNPANGHITAFIETRDIDRIEMQSILMRRLLETNYESALVVNSETGKIKIGFTNGDSDFTVEVTQTYDELAMRDILETVEPEKQEQIMREMSLASIRENLRTASQCSGRTSRIVDGKMSYKMWTAAHFDDEGEYILITISNITEVYQKDLENACLLKEALESAEVASRAKSTFLARMSHEIRTPITTVSGILDLIRQDCIKKSVIEDVLLQRVDTAASANQYLLTLINDILDISKIENDELTLTLEPADMRKVTDSLMAMVEPLAERKKINLVMNKSAHAGWYRTDGVRVSQILMNLMSNAIKFTPEGGTVVLTEAYHEMDEDNGKAMAVFTVRDTGVGISEAFRGNVFEPFKQEYNGNTSGYGGTGIGLAISRSLARLMGGDIVFESEKGKGSVFTASISLEPVQPQDEKTQTAGIQPQLEGYRVMVCEDNEVNQLIIKQLLESQGCLVITADNGVQAVDTFRESEVNSIDCILMDVRMPDMDGLQATRVIRSMDREDAASVPVIATSANAYEEDRQMSFDAGMNEHLSKPVDAELMFRTIEKYISRKT